MPALRRSGLPLLRHWWLCVLVGLMSAVSRQALATEPKPSLRILTTFAPIHSWTLNIVGDDASVELLLPGDVGPHDFQLRPQDLRKIRQADLIIANGLGMEGWLDKAIAGNAKESASRIVQVSKGLKSQLIYHLPVLSLDPKTARQKDHGHAHGHDHDHEAEGEAPNPHVWLDPMLASHGVSNIVEALIRADPSHATGYRTRASGYQTRLLALDDEIQKGLRSVTNRTIVTYHDAFPYFCRRYGLELAGVIEEIPSVSPSPKYLANLSAVIRARQVRVIFTEPQFNPRLVKQLTRDLGIQFTDLDVLETGEATAAFYEDAMRRNLRSLQTTLR